MINLVAKNKYTKTFLITVFVVIGGSWGVALAEIPIGCPGAQAAGPPSPGTVCATNEQVASIMNNLVARSCSNRTGGTADAIERNAQICRDNFKNNNNNKTAAAQIADDCKTKAADSVKWLICIDGKAKEYISTQSNTSAPNTITDTPKAIKSDCNADDLDESNCGIIKYLKMAINTLSAVAGVVIVGSVIFAGIQYSASADDPQAVAKAKGRIINALIALLLFVFGYGILNWLIPGGVL